MSRGTVRSHMPVDPTPRASKAASTPAPHSNSLRSTGLRGRCQAGARPVPAGNRQWVKNHSSRARRRAVPPGVLQDPRNHHAGAWFGNAGTTPLRRAVNGGRANAARRAPTTVRRGPRMSENAAANGRLYPNPSRAESIVDATTAPATPPFSVSLPLMNVRSSAGGDDPGPVEFKPERLDPSPLRWGLVRNSIFRVAVSRAAASRSAMQMAAPTCSVYMRGYRPASRPQTTRPAGDRRSNGSPHSSRQTRPRPDPVRLPLSPTTPRVGA